MPNTTVPLGQLSPKEIARFWRHVDRSGENGCWNWLSNCDSNGYGRCRVGSLITGTRRVVAAHRLSLWLAHPDMDQRLFVLHRCDNCRCVNPEHLFTGTQSVNMQDAICKGRFNVKGDANPNAKLTAGQVIEMRTSCAAGLSNIEAARRFGVRREHVSVILNRHLWGHV